ncbi:hypothetical protein B484DRAFT_405679 [Ochromonadaceae sp. CCMP2298]|nr:hypothetical protein B484DRAFT_405679 [Ochromonadaceae sp. CCMP2298]
MTRQFSRVSSSSPVCETCSRMAENLMAWLFVPERANMGWEALLCSAPLNPPTVNSTPEGFSDSTPDDVLSDVFSDESMARMSALKMSTDFSTDGKIMASLSHDERTERLVELIESKADGQTSSTIEADFKGRVKNIDGVSLETKGGRNRESDAVQLGRTLFEGVKKMLVFGGVELMSAVELGYRLENLIETVQQRVTETNRELRSLSEQELNIDSTESTSESFFKARAGIQLRASLERLQEVLDEERERVNKVRDADSKTQQLAALERQHNQDVLRAQDESHHQCAVAYVAAVELQAVSAGQMKAIAKDKRRYTDELARETVLLKYVTGINQIKYNIANKVREAANGDGTTYSKASFVGFSHDLLHAMTYQASSDAAVRNPTRAVKDVDAIISQWDGLGYWQFMTEDMFVTCTLLRGLQKASFSAEMAREAANFLQSQENGEGSEGSTTAGGHQRMPLYQHVSRYIKVYEDSSRLHMRDADRKVPADRPKGFNHGLEQAAVAAVAAAVAAGGYVQQGTTGGRGMTGKPYVKPVAIEGPPYKQCAKCYGETKDKYGPHTRRCFSKDCHKCGLYGHGSKYCEQHKSTFQQQRPGSSRNMNFAARADAYEADEGGKQDYDREYEGEESQETA